MSLPEKKSLRDQLFDFLATSAVILVGALSFLLAAVLCSCIPMADRIAGSSTEAGNAGGKLSLADGQPAADVSVALVARTYLPDTLSHGLADVPGMYYRTRTGPDGFFKIRNVAPGIYRLIAMGKWGGAMAESLQVKAGIDITLIINKTLTPLGSIHGVVVLVGSNAKVNLWVSPKATVLNPPRADSLGAFGLDSLPEGDYELVPSCYSCQPIKQGYKVRVRSGRDTLLTDTLKLYPAYFQGFPDSGLLALRTSFLPVSIGGKINRGSEDNVRPTSFRWTWNGKSIKSTDVAGLGGIGETMVRLDSAFFFSGANLAGGVQSVDGRLRLELNFPDTVITRDWHVVVDASRKLWPLSAVEVDGAVKVPGPADYPMWRFHVVRRMPLDSADVAFWGLGAGGSNQNALPDSVDLGVSEADQAFLNLAPAAKVTPVAKATSVTNLTFIVVPDVRYGGRVFRPRRDERLEDFHEIRFLRRDRLGFRDSLVPYMLPGGLILDRVRAIAAVQRYRIDTLGGVQELLAPTAFPVPPLLFYRSGPAAVGFSWDGPSRSASLVLTITSAGLATRVDGAGVIRLTKSLPVPELVVLDSLLAPMNGQPPSLPDTAALSGDGTWEYLHYGARGILQSAGAGGGSDALFTALKSWLVRNGLVEDPRFPLSGGAPLIYLGFSADSAGIRNTTDTLVLERAGDDSGLQLREYLSAQSPARLAGDTAVFLYRLERVGDSLVASAGPTGIASRLFGKIDGSPALFALAGLEMISPAYANGLPLLNGDAKILAGRITQSVTVQGRTIVLPSLFLDGREIDQGRQGTGFLYTPDGGLERSWRFGGHSGTVKGWDRQ